MKPLLYGLIPLLFLQMGAAFAQPAAKPAANPDAKALVAGNNAFAIDLYGQLRKQDGNLFFSPASISTAFAMAYAGARGSTAAEMAATLHFTLPPDRLHAAMGALLKSLNAAHTGYQLRVADALWAESGEKFLPDFLNLTNAGYGAGFHPIDFRTAPEAARATINQWVEQQTENKIKDLLPPGAVSPATRLVLTNAVYFKGTWSDPFPESATESLPFHVSASQSVQAPMMSRSGPAAYFDGGTFQALQLPYAGDALSMIVFLPRDIAGLPALERSFTAANAQKWLAQLDHPSKVNITFPKFTMTAQFELNNALSALGMRRAFEASAADFSGMTGGRDLFISEAVHKAYISVDEKGTEAAAATGLVFRATAMQHEPPPIVFNADHPFLFLIRDDRSGEILFMGRVVDPTR